MRIIDIREHTIPVARYADVATAPGGLTTSLVSVTTDVVRNGRTVVGYGFASVGRYGQGGLIRERFAPRLLAAAGRQLSSADGGDLDPLACWAAMMAGEKPGGHGERCVAVGTLDMAIWDAAAKIADAPLCRFIQRRLGMDDWLLSRVPVYAGGGYPYPENDLERLSEEIRRFLDLGFTHAKIKIGAADVGSDLRRVDVAASLLGAEARLAVDAMNVYTPETAPAVVAALAGRKLWWFEDPCDPLDFETQARVAELCPFPIAVGEALFSLAEAKLLDRHGGVHRDRDILVFDPVHCYGLTGYLQIVDWLLGRGWRRTAFWPHGGSLFCQHIVAALGLGGAEINPVAFAPFRGLAEGQTLTDGEVSLPDGPGIGFETHREIRAALEPIWPECSRPSIP
ncbi:MAG: enolase C-terminal domain-like protein [Gemmatimonadaceae bacterium]